MMMFLEPIDLIRTLQLKQILGIIDLHLLKLEVEHGDILDLFTLEWLMIFSLFYFHFHFFNVCVCVCVMPGNVFAPPVRLKIYM